MWFKKPPVNRKISAKSSHYSRIITVGHLNETVARAEERITFSSCCEAKGQGRHLKGVVNCRLG